MQVRGNITSSTGNILFDLDRDNQVEMILSSSGLGIGELSPAANLQVSGNAILGQSLSIGSSTSQNATLHVGGTLGFSLESTSTNLTLGRQSHVMANSSAGNLTLTLPNISDSNDGLIYSIKKNSQNHSVTVKGQGSYFDGQLWLVLNSGNLGAARVISHSGNWSVLSLSGGSLFGFSPADLSSVISWFDASDSSTILTSNGNITNWNDKVGSNHLSQTVAADRPTIGENINYRRSITFAQDYMDLTSKMTTVRAAFFVSNNLNGSNVATNVAPLYGEATNLEDQTFLRTNALDYSISVDGNNGGNGAASYNGNNTVVGTNIDLGMSNVEKNGVVLGYVQYDDPQDVDYIARLEANNTYKLIGDLGEVIFLNSIPSTSERQQMEGYLAHKWGIALPTSHPFRESPP